MLLPAVQRLVVIFISVPFFLPSSLLLFLSCPVPYYFYFFPLFPFLSFLFILPSFIPFLLSHCVISSVHYSLSLSRTDILITLFSSALSPCPSPRLGDQFPLPCKARDKVVYSESRCAAVSLPGASSAQALKQAAAWFAPEAKSHKSSDTERYTMHDFVPLCWC